MKKRYYKTYLVIITYLCLGLAGCSAGAERPDPPASVTLPPDLICGVFTPEQIAPLLTPATYVYSSDTGTLPGFTHQSDKNTLQGECALHTEGTTDYTLMISAVTADDAPWMTSDCDGPELDLHASVGTIESSASCQDVGEQGVAWAAYRGSEDEGLYNDYFRTTIIHATITSGENRSGVADATLLVQLVIDHMEASYRSSQATPTSSEPTST